MEYLLTGWQEGASCETNLQWLYQVEGLASAEALPSVNWTAMLGTSGSVTCPELTEPPSQSCAAHDLHICTWWPCEQETGRPL